MKVASIVGTRPQFIKLYSVSKHIRRKCDEVIIHTGQHYDNEMSQLFFDELKLPTPDHILGVGSGTHGYQTGLMIQRIEDVLLEEQPDMVLVYGDCNTTLAGAIAASKINIPVGHVEAGCRNYGKTAEELNRRCVDHISDLLFSITKGTSNNLEKENIPPPRIFNVGSTIVDACFDFINVKHEKHKVEDRYFILTLHRAGNVDNPHILKKIIESINKIEYPVLFPVHPRTYKNINKFNLLSKLYGNILLKKPLGYIDFLLLLNHAYMVISDSGSIQQEIMALKKKCVRLFENPLFPELNSYPGGLSTNASNILDSIQKLELVDRKRIENWRSPLGSGDAGRKISEIILK